MKRRTNFTDQLVKRCKTTSVEHDVEKSTKFSHLPNEIYREIFDYLSSFDLVQTFSGLNQRFNAVISDVPMKLRFGEQNKNVYRRILKNVVPKIIEQTISIDFDRSSDSDYFLHLFFRQFHLTQFVQLRSITLVSPSNEQLESFLQLIPKLNNFKSFRLVEQNFSNVLTETIAHLTLAKSRRCSLSKLPRLTHVYIEVRPPFKTIALLDKYLTNQIAIDHLQLTIHCNLLFSSQALKYLPYDVLTRLVPEMSYVRVNLLSGTSSSAFDFIQRFLQVKHLSVRTEPEAFANGDQWAQCLSQLPNLNSFNLNLRLDSDQIDREWPSFQTKFWSERHCRVVHPKFSSLCQIRCRTISFE